MTYNVSSGTLSLYTTTTTYRFEVIAYYCLNFEHCVFEPPLGHLGATYTVHLRLIRKLVVDFLFVLVELFSLGVTAEALRANIERKYAFLKGVRHFRPNFHIVGDVNANHFFARIHGPVNALQLCRRQYTHKETL